MKNILSAIILFSLSTAALAQTNAETEPYGFLGLVLSYENNEASVNETAEDLTLIKILPDRVFVGGKKYKIIERKVEDDQIYYTCKKGGKNYSINFILDESITVQKEGSTGDQVVYSELKLSDS